jgi:hypothetical protein
MITRSESIEGNASPSINHSQHRKPAQVSLWATIFPVQTGLEVLYYPPVGFAPGKGRGVTSAGVSPMAHLMPSSIIF